MYLFLFKDVSSKHGSSTDKPKSDKIDQNDIIDIDDSLFDDNLMKPEKITGYNIDDDFEINNQKQVSIKYYIFQKCIRVLSMRRE